MHYVKNPAVHLKSSMRHCCTLLHTLCMLSFLKGGGSKIRPNNITWPILSWNRYCLPSRCYFVNEIRYVHLIADPFVFSPRCPLTHTFEQIIYPSFRSWVKSRIVLMDMLCIVFTYFQIFNAITKIKQKCVSTYYLVAFWSVTTKIVWLIESLSRGSPMVLLINVGVLRCALFQYA